MRSVETPKREKLDQAFVQRIFEGAEKAAKYLSQFGRVLPDRSQLSSERPSDLPDEIFANIARAGQEMGIPSIDDKDTKLRHEMNDAVDDCRFQVKNGRLHVLTIRRPDGTRAMPGGFKQEGFTYEETAFLEGAEEAVEIPGINLDPEQDKEVLFQQQKKAVQHMRSISSEPFIAYQGCNFKDNRNRAPGKNQPGKHAFTTAYVTLVKDDADIKFREKDTQGEVETDGGARDPLMIPVDELLDGKYLVFSDHLPIIVVGAAAVLRKLGYQSI